MNHLHQSNFASIKFQQTDSKEPHARNMASVNCKVSAISPILSQDMKNKNTS